MPYKKADTSFWRLLWESNPGPRILAKFWGGPTQKSATVCHQPDGLFYNTTSEQHSLEGGEQCARTAALKGAAPKQTQKIVRSRAHIPGGLLSAMRSCIVL